MVLPAASSPIRLAEFLQMVTSEANDACNETGKKTITEEHVIAALRKLDFDRFASECAGIGGEEQARVLVHPPLRRPLFWPPPARLALGISEHRAAAPCSRQPQQHSRGAPLSPRSRGGGSPLSRAWPCSTLPASQDAKAAMRERKKKRKQPRGNLCAFWPLPRLPAHRRTRGARRAGAKSDDPRL